MGSTFPDIAPLWVWLTLGLLITAVAFHRCLLRHGDGVLEFLDRVFAQGVGATRHQTMLAVCMLAPALAVLTVFGFLPLCFSVFLSLYDVRRGAGPFVGLGNYSRALHAPEFWNSVMVTVWYVVIYVPVTMTLSIAIASGLRGVVRGRGWLRTIYFLPFVTSTVAAATVWRILLHPRHGVVSPIHDFSGLAPGEGAAWLLEPRGVLHLISGGSIPPGVGPSLALCCVLAFEIWRGTGFMVVVLLAGMSAIPRELEEAARLDGAGRWSLARYVTLPLLSPVLFFLAVVSGIYAFQAFDSVYALTGGGHGPLGTTRTITVYLFGEFYENGREGYGAAVAVLLCGCILMLTWLQWRVLGRKVFYR